MNVSCISSRLVISKLLSDSFLLVQFADSVCVCVTWTRCTELCHDTKPLNIFQRARTLLFLVIKVIWVLISTANSNATENLVEDAFLISYSNLVLLDYQYLWKHF